MFLLVIDMREEIAEITKIFHYWLSFIQDQRFRGQKPYLVVVGSHLDLLTQDIAKARGKEFQMFYGSIDTEAVQMPGLDCCKPKSKQMEEFQNVMSRIANDSPRIKLSLPATILLGLLEKDFSNVMACSTQVLLSHIEETSIQLIGKAQSLHPILIELHDLGLLFLIDSSNRESSSVILNMSQLTNIVHKSLFSEEALLNQALRKKVSHFRSVLALFRRAFLPRFSQKILLRSVLSKFSTAKRSAILRLMFSHLSKCPTPLTSLSSSFQLSAGQTRAR